jgi:hypothetical protein
LLALGGHVCGSHSPFAYPSPYVFQGSASSAFFSWRLLSFAAGAFGLYAIMQYSKGFASSVDRVKGVFIHEFALMLQRAKKKKLPLD